MGKALKKKQKIEAEKQLAFIESLNDRQKTAESCAKFKKREKKSLLDLPEFMLNHHLRINAIENFRSNTHSIEKRAKDALSFMYGKFAINRLFLDLFYKTQRLCREHAGQDDELKAIQYNLEFFGSLVINSGLGISAKSMLQKFLSKKEIAIFNTLSGSMKYASIFELFIYCKCVAKGIDRSICDVIVNRLRSEYYSGNVVRRAYGWRRFRGSDWDGSFLNITEKKNFFAFAGVCRLIEFAGAWKERLNPHIVGDILDFLISRKFEFNYKGRTFNSLVGCVIDWHIELNRQENEIKQGAKISFSAPYAHGPFCDWYDEDYASGAKVVCSQIRTYKKLCEEGRRQHHCVASYHDACARAASFIYTLRKYDRKEGEKILATIELNPGGQIVQARGLLNAPLKGEAQQILTRWKKERKDFV